VVGLLDQFEVDGAGATGAGAYLVVGVGDLYWLDRGLAGIEEYWF